MESLLKPKSKIRIGSWNVRTMFETSKLHQVTSEMDRYNLEILGISEFGWTGSGKIAKKDHTILFSGHDSQHSSGMAIIINKFTAKSLMEWYPVDDRIIVASFTQIMLN